MASKAALTGSVATMSTSEEYKRVTDLLDGVVEINASILRARHLLIDAEWSGDEESAKALRSEIKRLEMQKELGQTHDVPW